MTVAGEQAGPVGQRVVYEDDRVRVWDIVLEPGGYFGLHTHEHDYLIVTLEGARCKTQELQADGTWVEVYFDFEAGDVVPSSPTAARPTASSAPTTSGSSTG